jgi:hypothetical protein
MSMMIGEAFKRLVANKDRLPAAQWNKLVDRFEALLRSQPALGFTTSSGISHRNAPAAASVTKTYAKILETLQREDDSVTPVVGERDWYEIEILGLGLSFWDEGYGTYDDDHKVKYTDDGATKVYRCKIQHTAHWTKSPTNGTYWAEDSYTKAWVWGYTDSLLDAVPWLKVGELVEVVQYDHPDFPDRVWWVLDATPTKVTEGDEYSIMWNEDSDQRRAMAVFG